MKNFMVIFAVALLLAVMVLIGYSIQGGSTAQAARPAVTMQMATATSTYAAQIQIASEQDSNLWGQTLIITAWIMALIFLLFFGLFAVLMLARPNGRRTERMPRFRQE